MGRWIDIFIYEVYTKLETTFLQDFARINRNKYWDDDEEGSL